MNETETFQHYQVLKREDGSLWELGRGAMGVTYKAFDVNLRCHVALKVISNQFLDSEIARARFLREARAAAGLRHRNVASVYHLGDEDDSVFYSMEFIDGQTVEALVNGRGPLPVADALQVALQVARALGAAAKQGVVHRDIKPANLMVVHEDEDEEQGFVYCGECSRRTRLCVRKHPLSSGLKSRIVCGSYPPGVSPPLPPLSLPRKPIPFRRRRPPPLSPLSRVRPRPKAASLPGVTSWQPWRAKARVDGLSAPTMAASTASWSPSRCCTRSSTFHPKHFTIYKATWGGCATLPTPV